MNPKQARILLALRRPSGADDDRSDLEKALALAQEDPSWAEEVSAQRAFDLRAAAEIHSLEPDEADAVAFQQAAAALKAKDSGHHAPLRNPAIWAAIFGVLLMIGVLAWHVTGEAGIFPDEAVKIATAGAGGASSLFESTDANAGQLQDWFMMKGFDGFQVPSGLEHFKVVGGRIFKYGNDPVALAAIPDNTMLFYSFSAEGTGIKVRPEGTWRITEADRTVLAIREENGMCFMIAFRGTKAEMTKFLERTTGEKL